VRSDAISRVLTRTSTIFEKFASHTGETISLVARFGVTMRFIETYVADHTFAIPSRQGHILPAHRTSGGKALLSLMPHNSLVQLYRSPAARRNNAYLPDDEFRRFVSELTNVRKHGFAVNQEETERGIWAL